MWIIRPTFHPYDNFLRMSSCSLGTPNAKDVLQKLSKFGNVKSHGFNDNP